MKEKMLLVNHKKIALLSSAFIAVVLLVAVLTAAVGVYVFRWQNAYADKVAQVIPLSAGQVNGSTVSYHKYYQTADMLNALDAVSPKHQSQSEINKAAFEMLIAEQLLNNYIADRKLKINEAVVPSSYRKSLDKITILTPSQRSYLIHLRTLETTANQDLISDDKTQQESNADVLAVKAGLKAGQTYESLFEKYSDAKLSAANLPKGAPAPKGEAVLAKALPQTVADAGAKLAIGQTLTEPVVVEGTAYFLKRVDNVGQEVTYSVIRIDPYGLTDWLKTARSKAAVKRYLKQIQ